MTELQARNTSLLQIRRAWSVTESEKFDKITRAQVDARYVHVDNAWNRFAENCSILIENAQDDEEKQEHEHMYNETEEMYIVTRARLREKEIELRRECASSDEEQSEDENQSNSEIPAGQSDPPAPQTVQQPIVQQVQPPVMQQLQPQVQLQPIYIPYPNAGKIENTWGEFDGTLTQWQGFHDCFRVAVHENDQISNAFKFQHLKKSLKGKAAAAFGEWDHTDANYSQAWERLKQMYERKYQTSKQLFWKFFNLQKQERPSAYMLEKFSNITHSVLRQLKSLNYPVEHYDAIIVHSLHDRMDPETSKQWELYRKSETPSATEILDFIDWQAKAFANVQFNDSRENRKRTSSKFEHKGEKKAKPESDKSKKSDKSDKKEPQNPCAICEEAHPVYRCTKFQKMNLAARKRSVKEKNLCHNCLKPSHFSKDCPSRACLRCNVKHNSLLCPENPFNQSANTVQEINSSTPKHNNRKK